MPGIVSMLRKTLASIIGEKNKQIHRDVIMHARYDNYSANYIA